MPKPRAGSGHRLTRPHRPGSRVDAARDFAGRVTSTSVHPGVIVTGLHRDDRVHRPWFYAAYVAVVTPAPALSVFDQWSNVCVGGGPRVAAAAAATIGTSI